MDDKKATAKESDGGKYKEEKKRFRLSGGRCVLVTIRVVEIGRPLRAKESEKKSRSFHRENRRWLVTRDIVHNHETRTRKHARNCGATSAAENRNGASSISGACGLRPSDSRQSIHRGGDKFNVCPRNRGNRCADAVSALLTLFL